jgi:hypothetical protein
LTSHEGTIPLQMGDPDDHAYTSRSSSDRRTSRSRMVIRKTSPWIDPACPSRST